ncbi:hypothetical protein WNY37_08230 [Henriciella sp. AS95]|uniref:hypothetical protein n=1 Tax=Henriciella sp. AS95 TaxID=3135782 RepID=UPI00317863DF
MDDTRTPRPESLPTVTPIQSASPPSRHLAALEEARDRGRAFGWLGLGLALAWWVAAFGGVTALLGLEQLSEYSAAVIAAGGVALAIPGFMILLAGMLARENSRAASTNAVVLEAAARLLAPMEKTGSDATVFAEHMKKSASEVDRSMAHALSSMKAMAGEISDERQRLESVSYVTADNAKELSGRLGDERKALETLASDIRKQTEMMGEAIPRQAAQMRDSARAAASDIAQADQALEIRLETLQTASASLTEKVSSLDKMSVEAAKRSEELIFAVTRMEEKLEQSRKMVEQALRAGEMVAASASTTGDRLTDAVNSALERARMASRDIQAEALEASEKAARSLAALKTASLDATSAARQLKHETGMSDEQIRGSRLEVSPDPYLHEETRRDAARPAAQRGPSQPTLEDDDVFDEPAQTTARTDDRPPAQNRDDTELFEDQDEPRASRAPETPAATPKVEADNENEVEGSPVANEPVQFRRRASDRTPGYLKPVGGRQAANLAAAEDFAEDEDTDMIADAEAEPEIEIDIEPDVETEIQTPPAPAAETRADSQQWRDIIADMERDEQAPLPREENAEEIIHRLLDSGIRLSEIFRPRDKKRIANAARKSEGMRRKAIVDAAARQVQRVQKRLDADRQLMAMAREFLTMEEPDALMALDKTCHSSKSASPRLAAFLLIDAALG